jgi:hypothetical protein
MEELARSIPHEYRNKILFEWLPGVRAEMTNENYRFLFEAYFIYIEPDGIQKTDCQRCLNNILTNWKSMAPYIRDAELEFNTLEKL